MTVQTAWRLPRVIVGSSGTEGEYMTTLVAVVIHGPIYTGLPRLLVLPPLHVIPTMQHALVCDMMPTACSVP